MDASPARATPTSSRLPCIALAFVLAAAALFLFSTVGDLPATVATHFDGAGKPNGWMSRDGYLAFMLVFTIGLSVFVTAAIGMLPRRFPRLTNIPNREYWLAAERRESTLAHLRRHGCWLGCGMVVFTSAIHALILDAHAADPPRLANGHLVWMMAAFLVALTLWAIVLFRRFSKAKPQPTDL